LPPIKRMNFCKNTFFDYKISHFYNNTTNNFRQPTISNFTPLLFVKMRIKKLKNLLKLFFVGVIMSKNINAFEQNQVIIEVTCRELSVGARQWK